MPRVRVHQHVNPLSPFYCFTPKPIEIKKVFANPNSPLHLDIGAARGRFLLKMAESFPEKIFSAWKSANRSSIEANRIAAENNLTNLHYEFNNATFSLNKLLEALPQTFCNQ